jgi:succinoglycan biosynthesis transport protein ExoP
MTAPKPRAELDSGVTPDSVMEVWHRRKWVGVLVFTAVFAATITATASLPDLYRASATVLVDRQEVSEAFVRPSVTAELETRIQTIHQRVTSRARLTDLIGRLGLYPELRGVVPIEVIVERMRRDIQLQLKGVEQSTGRSTTISFSVGYTGRSPDSVAEVTNTLAGFYVDENTSSRARQAAKTAEFLSGQLVEAKRVLDEQERQTSEFTMRHTDELPEQLQANLAAIERLNTQVRLNGEYQLRVIERRERLEKEHAGAASATPGSDPPAAVQLVRLRQQLADLRSKFSDQYPDVRRVRAEIAALEDHLARPETVDAKTTASGDSSARLKSLEAGDDELRSLKQQEASLRRMIAAYETRIDSAPRRQQEIQQLSRGYEMTKERYQTLLKQYEEAQLAARLEQGQSMEQFRVLDAALPPLWPAAPNRLWLAFMGLMGALALAVGAVVAIERFDTTFHTADDLRAFADVPMLATIRKVATKSAVRRRRFQHALVAASVVVGLVLVVAGTYYVAAGNEQLVRMMVRGAA